MGMEADDEAVLEAVPLLLLKPPSSGGGGAGGACARLRWVPYALASVTAALAFFVVLGLMSPGVIFRHFIHPKGRHHHEQHPVVNCSVRLVESIPEGLTYNSSVRGMDTFEVAPYFKHPDLILIDFWHLFL